MLWFENFALSFLPKWASDIATTIHFYEAVLATLAILVWHFYWVIFDPEVYPMDASWWHGKPPAARVIERMAENRGYDAAQAEPNEMPKPGQPMKEILPQRSLQSVEPVS